MKQNKGITLVALVITIIVLLILAGVSISLVLGDNGVLSNAKDSATETKIAQMREALSTALGGVQTDYYAKKYTDDTTVDAPTSYSDFLKDNLNKELGNAGYKIQVKGSDSNFSDTLTFSNTETEYKILDESGNGDYLAVKIKVDGEKVTTNFSKKLSTLGDYEKN